MVPMKKNDPAPGRISIVFLPIQPSPARCGELALGHRARVGVDVRDRGAVCFEEIGEGLESGAS